MFGCFVERKDTMGQKKGVDFIVSFFLFFETDSVFFFF